MLILEIAMLVAGLGALIVGKLHVTKAVVVEGTPARLAGLCWVLPLPSALLLVVILLGGDKSESTQRTMAVIEIIFALACLVAGIVIAAVNVKKPRKKRRRDDDDDEFEDEYEAPVRGRRRRADDFDDEEENCPVRPRKGPTRRADDDAGEEVEPPVRPTKKPQVVQPVVSDFVTALCPNCEKSYNLPGNLAGKKVRCKQCQEVFLVEALRAVEENDAPAQDAIKAKKPRQVPPRANDEEDDEPPPPRKRSR